MLWGCFVVLLLWPSAVRAQPSPGTFSLGVGEDGFFLRDKSGAYSLNIQISLQFRLTYRAVNADKGVPLSETELAAYIRRGRLTLEGSFFLRQLTYKMQLAFDRGQAKLKDLFLDYNFVDGFLALRVGQFKRPFSRQFLTSGKKQEFVGRSILHDFFWVDRDLGLMFHNDNGGKKGIFGWSVGLFNGTEDDLRHLCDVESDPKTLELRVTECEVTHRPAFVKPALVGRIQFHTPGFKGRSEGDLKGGLLRWAVGAGVYVEWDADGDGTAGMQFEVDTILKVKGFASVVSVQLSTREEERSFFKQKFYAIGALGQISYVFQTHYHVGFRYAFISPFEEKPRQEASVVFGIYIFGHRLKWQLEGSLIFLDVSGEQTPFFRTRTQLQCSL